MATVHSGNGGLGSSADAEQVTYGQFLAVFLVVPLGIVFVLGRHRLTPLHVGLLAAISVMALVYTTPWDNLLIANGVWSYGPRQVLGLTVGRVPLEECAFYVLQVFLSGAVTVFLLRRRA